MPLPPAERVRRAVERFWAAHGPDLAGRPLAVGVSGGPASVTLLHALARAAGPRLVAIYVDHGQRRAEVAAEIALVERLSADLGTQFLTCAAQTTTPAGRPAGGWEAIW